MPNRAKAIAIPRSRDELADKVCFRFLLLHVWGFFDPFHTKTGASSLGSGDYGFLTSAWLLYRRVLPPSEWRNVPWPLRGQCVWTLSPTSSDVYLSAICSAVSHPAAHVCSEPFFYRYLPWRSDSVDSQSVGQLPGSALNAFRGPKYAVAQLARMH